MIQDSSLKAYYAIKASLGAGQKQVFVALSAVPNATNRELVQMTGLPVNEITPHVKELRERSIVVEACQRRCKISGRTVIGWKSVAPSLPPAFPPKPVEKQSQLFA